MKEKNSERSKALNDAAAFAEAMANSEIWKSSDHWDLLHFVAHLADYLRADYLSSYPEKLK